jgi:hypothetical protein
VTSTDYNVRTYTPTLARHISPKKSTSHVRSSLAIPDVVGQVDVSQWETLLANKCKASIYSLDASMGMIPTTFSPTPQVISVSFPAPSSSPRGDDLLQNDAYLSSIIDLLSTNNYTVLYTTSTHATINPNSENKAEYTMPPNDLEKFLHSDLKRDLESHQFAQRSNITLPEGALFHRYQFFTPGSSLHPSALSHVHSSVPLLFPLFTLSAKSSPKLIKLT